MAKDKRIKQTKKVSSLNIPFWSNKQKLTRGIDMYLGMIQKEPTVGRYKAPKKTRRS